MTEKKSGNLIDDDDFLFGETIKIEYPLNKRGNAKPSNAAPSSQD